MPIRVFSEQEKEELRVKMLECGMKLLKQHGMTHMSIAKIAKEVGIGKSTFYNFFKSKEEFINEMLKYQREKSIAYLKNMMVGKDKLSASESKKAVRYLALEADNLYKYLTPEEEGILYEKVDEVKNISLPKEVKRIDFILSLMEGVRDEIDYPVVANIMKVMAIVAENKYLLHMDGYERTQEELLKVLYAMVFEEE